MLRRLALAALCGVAGLHGGAPAMAQAGLDHFTTGYGLTGQHRVVPCDLRPVDAIYRGTPRGCAACHTSGTRIAAGRSREDQSLLDEPGIPCLVLKR